jgi:hypothetical protein
MGLPAWSRRRLNRPGARQLLIVLPCVFAGSALAAAFAGRGLDIVAGVLLVLIVLPTVSSFVVHFNPKRTTIVTLSLSVAFLGVIVGPLGRYAVDRITAPPTCGVAYVPESGPSGADRAAASSGSCFLAAFTACSPHGLTVTAQDVEGTTRDDMRVASDGNGSCHVTADQTESGGVFAGSAFNAIFQPDTRLECYSLQVVHGPTADYAMLGKCEPDSVTPVEIPLTGA